MNGVMEFVMESFAAHAADGARLVIKNHPLDAGLVNFRRVIAALEKRFALAGRIDYRRAAISVLCCKTRKARSL